MKSTEALLRAVGQLVRQRRASLGLTQAQLGKKAGIVGKYVSEIERGTRDLPLSTLVAVVEHGLGLRLELTIAARNGNGNGSRLDVRVPPVPPTVEDVSRNLAALPAEQRSRVLSIIQALIELAPHG